MKLNILLPLASFFACLLSAVAGHAEPIDFNEVSLLVRAGENQSFIIREVSQRKLMRPLTPQQESTLKAQGAGEGLLRALRNPNLALSPAEAAVVQTERERRIAGRANKRASGEKREGEEIVRIFDVSFGHPINLSRWGGPDYELAILSKRFVGEDYTVASVRNGGWNREVCDIQFTALNDLGVEHVGEPVLVSCHSSGRTTGVDMNNPASIKGIPYVLYPVYAAGKTSLYYIGTSTEHANSAKLAVVLSP